MTRIVATAAAAATPHARQLRMSGADGSNIAPDRRALQRGWAHNSRLNRDVPALERLWPEHFTVNAPNNQVVVGRQGNLAAFVSAFWRGSTRGSPRARVSHIIKP